MALTPPFEQLSEGTQEGNGCPSAVAARGGEGSEGGCVTGVHGLAETHTHTCTHAHVLRARPFRNGVPQNDVSLRAHHAIPRAGRPLPLGLLPPVPAGMSEITLVAGNVFMFCPFWGITCQCGLVLRDDILSQEGECFGVEE